MVNPFLESLRRINQLGIPYLAGGGFSVVMHGVNRFTPDLNLITDLSGDAPKQLLEGLASCNLKPEHPKFAERFCTAEGRVDMLERQGQWCLPFSDPELPNFSVDIFLKHPVTFSEVYERRHIVEFDNCPVPIVSLEDLIVMKHVANRGQDKADIENLLIVQDIRRIAHDEEQCKSYIEQPAKISQQEQIENLVKFFKLTPMEKADWLAEMLEQLGKFCFM